MIYIVVGPMLLDLFPGAYGLDMAGMDNSFCVVMFNFY